MIGIKFSSDKMMRKMAAIIAVLKTGESVALDNIGKELTSEMKRTIDEELESWPPLSPRTISIKGNDKILIDDNTMYDSIKWKRDGKSVIIGVHADAPANRGKVAAIHEHGAPEAHIPARPFVEPTWDREKKKMSLKYSAVLKEGVKRVL
jgi:phage gpG-like protein